MTTSATMTTMVMTITVRAVFSCASMSKCHLGQTLARHLSSGPSKPIAWMSLCLVLGRVELQVDPHAVVLPHANKGRTVLHSRHAIHAGGSLSNCEISSICCCVIISNAVWAGPLVPSMGRLSINGH